MIRPAKREDCNAIYSLLMELAEYEHLRDTVTATEADICEALFGKKPVAESLIAYRGEEAVGVAVFYTTFSTFVGWPGMYLEDIYVKPEIRGKGIGKAFLNQLARIARQRNYGRMEWAVLNWNKPAIDFYKSIGAEPLEEWTTYRMFGESIDRLAEGAEK
ncbi:GNAT family N-acetyltransferase [bacterium]|nr:GNAT family N-acetyltransferase [bacterium]